MSDPLREYWGGSTVKGGQVRKLDASSFAELVDRLFDKPVCLPYTRAEWGQLTDDERKKAKDGPYVCSCSFKEGTTLRNDANADLLQMVSFDIDDPDLARDFVESPKTLEDALWPNDFVAYTTASSTPENPRLRIMVPVEPCDPAEHKRITFYVAHSRLGLPRKWAGRRESFTLSLPFYRPVKLEGEEFKAVIASRTNGEPVQLRDLPAEVTEEVDRIYAYQSDGDDDSDLSNLPVFGLEVEDIREPLFRIDPDCGYQQWCEIACAMLHNFREEEQAAEAFAMFVEWSEGGDKFRGEDDCYAKWKSFRPDYKGRRPVTIKSLFHHAMDAGWSNTKVVSKLKDSVGERINACEDINLLMTEGLEWLAGLPFRNDVMDQANAKALQARIQQLKGPRIETAAILKSVNKERRATRAEAASGNRPAWLRPWCYISTLDKFLSTATGILLTPEAFNHTFNSEMMAMNNEASASGRPVMSAKDFALNTEGMITKVDAMVYDPRFGGENSFFRIPGDDRMFVNEYRAASVPRIDDHAIKNADKAGKAFRRLVRDQFSREEDILHLIDWIAHLFQFPGERMRHVPCIQGAQGSGKSLISGYIAAGIGKSNHKVVYPKDLDGKHNDWAVGAQLVTLEEIHVQGKDRPVVMNCLKPLITNDDTAIHQKFRDIVTVPNTVNYIAYTNHHNALYLEESDRRWWVVKSKVQSKQQVMRLSAKEVAGMPNFDYHGMVLGKFGGAIRQFFLNYEIRSSFNPNGEAPVTPWREQMVRASENSLQRDIREAIGDKVPLIGDDIIYLPALVRHLKANSISLKDNNHPSHFLYLLGFQPYGEGKRYSVNGSGKGEIWVNGENYEEMFGHPLDIIMERYGQIPDETI